MERRLAAVMAADMVGYSRLMEKDEAGVLDRQKSHRRELIDPEISQNRGRIVKTTGDGMLVEFASAQDAVRSALDIQRNMANREEAQDEDNRIQYRIGINLGDILFDEDDIFGDGVNVAARLETLAEPGGICVSDQVLRSITDRITAPFRDMGSQRVKNISRPVRVWQWTLDAPRQDKSPEISHQQRVRFCRSADGTHIAHATVGEGVPVVKAPNWMTHIEYECDNPIWGPFLSRFSENFRLTRFDQRGTGLSDWDVDEISDQTMLADMEAVVDAEGLKRFALFGISQGAGFSIDYACKHPDKVSCLVLLGGYLRGRRMRDEPEQLALYRSAVEMINSGWGSPNSLFRQFFTSSFIPEAGPEQHSCFDELQRMTVNTDNALRIFEMNARIDLIETAKKLDVPTLVLHVKGDKVVPVEEGRLMARSIPGAEFVELSGSNHAIMEGTACFDTLFDEMTAFINRHHPGE